MISRRALFLLGALVPILAACYSLPLLRKENMRAHLIHDDVKEANYLLLYRFWDENARKAMLNSNSNTFTQVFESTRMAEITIGNGPYYGMIELIGESDNRTRIRVYFWGATSSDTISEWRSLLLRYPNK